MSQTPYRPEFVLSSRPWPVRVAMFAVWGLFLIFPVCEAAVASGDAERRALIVAGGVAFAASYAYMVASHAAIVLHGRDLAEWTRVGALALMLAIGAALTLVNPGGWGYLFSYATACATLLASDRLSYVGIGLATALAVALPALAGAGGGAALGFGASAAGVGLIMILVRDLRQRNREVFEARSELARLAVAQERERFARDLHDLLGHSLSVIALKAELAGRLLAAQPQRSAAEITDIESVARTALQEVRDAVSGYRRLTLDGELEGARMALLAAGVECEIDWDRREIDPETEAVLAWAVREGATNVIRHSAATRCVLRVSTDPDATGVEVVDDGSPGRPAPAAAAGSAGGHGLSGLGERVAALRGTVAAGPLAGGGYRLSVTVPGS